MRAKPNTVPHVHEHPSRRPAGAESPDRSTLCVLTALTFIAALVLGACAASPGRSSAQGGDLAPAPEALRVQTLWTAGSAEYSMNQLLPDDGGGLSLALSDTMLIVAMADGSLSALDASSGEERWRRESDSPWIAAPVSDSAVVYLSGSDGHLEAASATDGRTIWRRSLGAPLTNTPTLTAGYVLTIDSAQRLHVIDRESGEAVWTFSGRRAPDLSIQADARPLVTRDAVYAGFGNGTLYRLNRDGEMDWARDLAGGQRRLTDVLGQPLLHLDTIFAATLSGGLFALDPDSGETRWHQGEGIQAGPFASGDNIVALTEANELVWRDAQTGAELYRQHLPWAGVNALVASGPFLIAPTYTSGLAILALDRPYLLTRHTAATGFAGSVAMSRDRLYVRSRTGRVLALSVAVRSE